MTRQGSYLAFLLAMGIGITGAVGCELITAVDRSMIGGVPTHLNLLFGSARARRFDSGSASRVVPPPGA